MTEKFRVLISDEMSPEAAQVLAQSAAIDVDVKAGISGAALLAEVARYDGLVVRSRTKVTKEVIAAASRLKIIGRAGIGVDNIDVDAASQKGIVVENAPNGNAVTTAEHAISLLFSLARHIPQATASMKQGRWEKKRFQGVELFEKTLGIIGLGNIGRIVASRALGLGMAVVACDPFADKVATEALGVQLLAFDELLRRADFVTIHTPKTDKTAGLLDRFAFQNMKNSAYLINAARGGIVDEEALAQALDDGEIAGAAFDVFAVEPPPENHPLVRHPKVICTPHLGASTAEAQIKVALEVAQQIVLFAETGEVRNAVNRD